MLSKIGLITLVSRLSVELGHLYVDESTFHNLPCTVGDYTDAILEAEGFTPGVGGDLSRATRRIVSEVFEEYCQDA